MRKGTHPLDKKAFSMWVFDEYGCVITERTIYAQTEERAKSIADELVAEFNDAAYYELTSEEGEDIN